MNKKLQYTIALIILMSCHNLVYGQATTAGVSNAGGLPEFIGWNSTQSDPLQIRTDAVSTAFCHIQFFTDAQKLRMTVRSEGNVAVGSNPQAQQQLSVEKGIIADQGDFNDGSMGSGTAPKYGITFGSSSSEGIGSNRCTTIGCPNPTVNPHGLDFYTSAVNRMVITTGGNVGIALTAPSRKLDVFDGVNPQLRLTRSAPSTLYTDFQTTSNGDMNIMPTSGTNARSVGINKLSPSTTLHVGGTAGSTGAITSDFLNHSSLPALPGSNPYLVYSDANGKLLNLRPASFGTDVLHGDGSWSTINTFGKCGVNVPTLTNNIGITLGDQHIYFDGNGYSGQANDMNNSIGIGYGCTNSTLPGKLSVDQTYTHSNVDARTTAGYFHNGDVTSQASSAFEKRGIWSVCDGLHSNGHNPHVSWYLTNIGK